MTREEKITLLTDTNKTDKEVAEILGVSIGYLPVLRRRWKLPAGRNFKIRKFKNNPLEAESSKRTVKGVILL